MLSGLAGVQSGIWTGLDSVVTIFFFDFWLSINFPQSFQAQTSQIYYGMKTQCISDRISVTHIQKFVKKKDIAKNS